MRYVFVSSMMLLSCATVLSETAKGVRLMKSDPAAECTELGDLSSYGNGVGQGAIDDAKLRLRNKAAEMGANFVRMETVNFETATVGGTAFKCPEGSPASAE